MNPQIIPMFMVVNITTIKVQEEFSPPRHAHFEGFQQTARSTPVIGKNAP